MKVSGILIDNINKEGKLKYLAVFIYMKSLNTNSCIYNYSQDRLAAELKLSKSSIRKYINYYLDNGWAKMIGKHLHFNKIRLIGKQKRLVWYEIKLGTVKEITDNLYLYLFKHKTEQTKWYTKTCRDLKTLNERDYRKKINGLIKRYPYFRERIEQSFGAIDLKTDFKVSISKISKWFKCSVGKAHKIIKRLCKEHKMLVVLGGYRSVAFHKFDDRDLKTFVSRAGNIVTVECNRYFLW